MDIKGGEKVCLTITGTQYPAGETEPVTTIQKFEALFIQKGETCYWLYEEKIEGARELRKARIKHKGKVLEIVRHSGNMVFDVENVYRTEYRTPYGKLILDIVTKSVERQQAEDGSVAIKAFYTLENAGQPFGEYELHIHGK